MTVAAVMMARDEADIVATTVENLARQVDFVIVADNRSTDGTREALEAVAETYDVTIVDDPEPGYYQSAKMTVLARQAGARGANWIVPADADEAWCSSFGPVGKVLETQVPPTYYSVGAAIYDHMATARDHDSPDPVRRMPWRRRQPLPLVKVACRWREDLVIHQGNHGASYDMVAATLPGELLVVRHFPYRSVEQFVRKVRNGAEAYAATGDDLDPEAGAHWRQWGAFSDEELAGIFHTWYYRAEPQGLHNVEGQTLEPLICDPAPLPWG